MRELITDNKMCNELNKISEREKERKKEEMEREDRERAWQRDQEERERKFELEKLAITTSHSAVQSTPRVSEISLQRMTPELKGLMPKFDVEETDISLFLSLFERQARTVQVDES